VTTSERASLLEKRPFDARVPFVAMADFARDAAGAEKRFLNIGKCARVKSRRARLAASLALARAARSRGGGAAARRPLTARKPLIFHDSAKGILDIA
jgi:hypothetical protein